MEKYLILLLLVVGSCANIIIPPIEDNATSSKTNFIVDKSVSLEIPGVNSYDIAGVGSEMSVAYLTDDAFLVAQVGGASVNDINDKQKEYIEMLDENKFIKSFDLDISPNGEYLVLGYTKLETKDVLVFPSGPVCSPSPEIARKMICHPVDPLVETKIILSLCYTTKTAEDIYFDTPECLELASVNKGLASVEEIGKDLSNDAAKAIIARVSNGGDFNVFASGQKQLGYFDNRIGDINIVKFDSGANEGVASMEMIRKTGETIVAVVGLAEDTQIIAKKDDFIKGKLNDFPEEKPNDKLEPGIKNEPNGKLSTPLKKESKGKLSTPPSGGKLVLNNINLKSKAIQVVSPEIQEPFSNPLGAVRPPLGAMTRRNMIKLFVYDGEDWSDYLIGDYAQIITEDFAYQKIALSLEKKGDILHALVMPYGDGGGRFIEINKTGEDLLIRDHLVNILSKLDILNTDLLIRNGKFFLGMLVQLDGAVVGSKASTLALQRYYELTYDGQAWNIPDELLVSQKRTVNKSLGSVESVLFRRRLKIGDIGVVSRSNKFMFSYTDDLGKKKEFEAKNIKSVDDSNKFKFSGGRSHLFVGALENHKLFLQAYKEQ